MIQNIPYRLELLHSSKTRFPPGSKGVGVHWHPVYHVLFYDKGPGTLLLGNRIFEADPGLVVLISPNEKHQFRPKEKYAHGYSEITFGLYDSAGRPCQAPFQDIFSGLGMNIPVLKPVKPPVQVFRGLYRELETFCGEGYNPSTENREKCDLTIRIMLFLDHLGSKLDDLSLTHSERAIPCLSPISKAMAHLTRHYAEPVTLHDMARLSGWSREHFSRMFKASAGCGFGEYLTKLRLDVAERMLTTGGLPVKTVAGQSGFEDVYYFTRCFSRRFKSPPAAYVRAWQARQLLRDG